MKKLSLQEMKKIELDMLKEFDSFCKCNNLKYSLGAGTLIGAARHKGFIPWDDDIDIFMMRSEYDQLVSIIQQGGQLSKNEYEVLLPGNPRSIYPFIKIVNNSTILYEKNIQKKYSSGVWIDIFPVDYLGNDEKTAMKKCEVMKRKMETYLRYHVHLEDNSLTNFFKNTYISLANIIGKRRLQRLKNELISFRGEASGKYCGTVIWPQSIKDVYPTEYFKDYTTLEFEKQDFMVFSDYDKILTHRFGDYMTLPSEDNRKSHNPDAYLL